MPKTSKIFIISLVTTANVLLFSVPQAMARNPIDIDIGLNLNALIADQVNDLAGHKWVDFVPHSIATENNANVNTSTARGNTIADSGGKVAGASIAKVAGTATGTTGSLLLSAVLSLVVASLYAAYAQTYLFKKRETLAVINRHRSDKNRFNFVL